MKLKKEMVIYGIILMVALQSVGLRAGPTIIRDERIRDTGMTPVPGRGYSIATNTLQSLCLKNVVLTKPSYNFQYKFEQLESDGSRTSDLKAGAGGSGSASWLLYTIRVKDAKSETTVRNNVTYHKHRILVTVLVDSYYSSVNEAATYLSASAQHLLENRDIPGFFDSCGPYYIRSVGRFSKFVSVFTYETDKKERNVTFENKLEMEIKGLFSGSVGISAELKTSFQQEATNKRLTIDSVAFGLGKDREASLIAYDLESFKSAVKDSFLTMQDEEVGLVNTIEVVPWVENTEFQKAVALETIDVPDGSVNPESESDPDAEGEANKKTVPFYKQKRILNLNGEFLAEMDRSARLKMNLYFKAKMCRGQIEEDWKQDDKAWEKNKTKTMLNNRDPIYKKSLEEVYNTLANRLDNSKPDSLYKDYISFVYGDDSGSYKGTIGCVSSLLDKGISTTMHYQVPECTAVLPKMPTPVGSTIDNYCMPMPLD